MEMSSKPRSGTLKFAYQQTLRFFHEYLCEEIDAQDLIDRLYARNILSRHDVQEVQALPSQRKRTRELLFMITKATDNGFHQFMLALKDVSPHAAEKLESLASTLLTEEENICAPGAEKEQLSAAKGTAVTRSDGVPGPKKKDSLLPPLKDQKEGDTDLHIPFMGIVRKFVEKTNFFPLHYVSQGYHADVVKFLLASGANPVLSTEKGDTDLHLLSLKGYLGLVQAMVEDGAQVDLQDQTGFTPLHLASQGDHADVVKFLLARGANPGLSTENGNTALHIASLGGHLAIVQYLVDNGAQVNLQNQFGFTPLHLACQEDYALVVKFLLASVAYPGLSAEARYAPMNLASQADRAEVVKFLLASGANPRLSTEKGNTALHTASLEGHLGIVQQLVDNGAQVNLQNQAGFRPLHLATQEGRAEVVNFLLARGARPVLSAEVKAARPQVVELKDSYNVWETLFDLLRREPQ